MCVVKKIVNVYNNNAITTYAEVKTFGGTLRKGF